MAYLGSQIKSDELRRLQEKEKYGSVAAGPKTYIDQGESHLKIEPGLPLYKQPRFLRGVFSILLISIIMSTFELVFFYAIAKPLAEKQLDKYLDGVLLQPEIGLPYTTPDGVPGTNILYQAALERIAEEERAAMDRNNALRGAAFSVFVLFLVLLLFLVDRKLHQEAAKVHYVRIFGGEVNVSIATAIFAALLLVTFQVNFFIFGQEFNYIGSEGPDEFLLVLLNSLRKATGMEPIT